MHNFEDQLSASARRLRKQSESNLHVPDAHTLPRRSRKQYWGWIATPAAAVIGLLIGLFIGRPATEANDFVIPVVAASDTSGHNILDDGTDYSLFVSL